MMGFKKRSGALSFVLAFSMLLGVFSVLFSLESSAEVYEYTAHSKLASEVDEETLYKKKEVLDDLRRETPWTGSEFVKSLTSTEYIGNVMCLLMTADNDMRNSLGISREFDAVSCEGYSELSFAFLALGGTGNNYTLETVILSGEDRHVYTVPLTSNTWNDIFLDISDVNTIDFLSVTVYGKGTSTLISSAAIHSIVMGDLYHGKFASQFAAIDVTGAKMSADGITVTPDGMDAVVRANAMLPDSIQTEDNSTAIMCVTLSGLSYANMTVSTGAEPVWKMKEFAEKASVTVTSAQDTYVCCFPIEGRIVSWELKFSAVSADGSFEIEKIEIITGDAETPEEYALDATLGSVNRYNFISSPDGDKISISGKLARDAAVKYIEGEICLYMIPLWKSLADVIAEEPFMALGTSTNFEFTVDLSSNQIARAARFAVALRNDDGTMFFTSPLSPLPIAALANSSLSDRVYSGTDCADVFLAGPTATVIDIPLDRLILAGTSTNAKLTPWGDSYIYLDRAVLSSVEKMTKFYDSCGIAYYFRLLASSDIFMTGAGKNASGYAFDVSAEENANTLCAAVEYLSANFTPAGYMMGSSLNSSADSCSAKFGDIFGYIKSQATAAQCVYSIAASHNHQTVLLLPFDSVSETELLFSNGDIPIYHRAALCAALSDYYTASSAMKWTAVTSVTEEDPADITPAVSNITGSGYLGTVICLDDRNGAAGGVLKSETVREVFPEARALFVFDSEADFIREEEYFSEVNEMPHQYSYTGKLSLWDFSKSFMTYSWNLSDGSNPTTQISSALTDVTAFSTCRALHLEMNGDGSDVVAAAKIPYSSLDISRCSDVELLMTAASENGTDVSFTVMIGNDEKRCVFPLTVPSGVAVSVICHVDGEMVPEYFAIISEEGAPCVIDIASVSANSETLTSEQLNETVSRNTENTDEKKENGEDLISLILVSSIILFSVVTFALLSKKKR